MRYLFALLLFIHGLLHMMGFAKAYDIGNVPINSFISKPLGIIWLQVSFLFVSAAILYLAKSFWWMHFSLLAVFMSQIVIIIFWQDAKWGTCVNVIILSAAIASYAEAILKKETNNEVSAFLSRSIIDKKKIISSHDISTLPPIVQKWLLQSGIIGKENILSAKLEQKGHMYLKQGGRPVPYEASEYFYTTNPSFLWDAKVEIFPLVYLNGKDTYLDGKGAMQIKAMALFDIVDEKPGYKINEGAMLRYLGEICWFPTAAISHCIQWQPIDSLSAKATMTYEGSIASGVFSFHDDGKLRKFSAERFNGAGDNSIREQWMVEVGEYKAFEGLNIPTACSVSWLKKDGWFKWLTLDVTDVSYNKQNNFLN